MSIFAGKSCVVTGGASGIGRALARAMAQRGATAVVADLDRSRAEQVAQEIRAAGGAAWPSEVDVVDPEAVQRTVDEVIEREGRIDYLFNNAGISLFGEVRDMTLEQWSRLFAVNVTGVVNGVAAAYPRMIAQGSGHIVNTASMAGIVPTPGATAYAATKHAVVGLSTGLRGEAAAYGVKVSVFCPGLIDTPMKDALTYVNLDKDKMLTDPRVRLTSADKCAEVVLSGVERNRSIIPVTPLAWTSWLAYRLSPNFLSAALARSMMGFARKHYSTRPSA